MSSASSQSSVYTGRQQSAPCATRQVVNTRQSFFFTKQQQQQQRAINTDYRSGGHKTSWTSAGGENTSSPNAEGTDHKEKKKTEMIMERVTSKYNSEDVHTVENSLTSWWRQKLNGIKFCPLILLLVPLFLKFENEAFVMSQRALNPLPGE